MPAKRPTRPKQRPRLRTGTLMDATPQAVSRHLSDIATEVERLDGEFDVFTANKDGRTPASGGGTATFLRADGKWATPSGGISLPIAESDVTNLVTDLSGKAPTSRLINTTAPLTGGGDLGADRTLAVSTFSAGSAGVVPASGGGTVNYLRADGTWADPTLGANLGSYGDASDGNVTIAVNTTLTRDMFYNNLTVNTGVVLRTGGFRVHVAGVLTLTGNIDNSGYAGGNGTALLAGAAGVGADSGSTGGGANGGIGGFNGGGANGSGANPAPRGMTAGGTGGVGGVIGNAGGTPSIVSAGVGEIRNTIGAYLAKNPAALTTILAFGSGGGGGHSTNGSGGGGGGGGGGYCFVAARTWTGAGSITANGGKGGDAFASVTISSGGGGGGSGGWVSFVTKQTTVPTISAAGGAGGARSGAGISTDGTAGGAGFSLPFYGVG